LNRIECLDAFARLRGEAIVVVGPGFAGHELASAEHTDLTLYNMDMGYALPLCLGIALAQPTQRVVAIEGDGSLVMALSSLTTLARYAPANLTVIVFDNGYYLTTGSGSVESVTAHGADLAALGRAAGLRQVVGLDDIGSFETAARQALGEPGPWLIVARVDTTDRNSPRARGGFSNDIVEQAVLFQVALRERGISQPA
jgi:thiamine pyrophosphate-dependent acetolactate synthase large subunit-like protein